jgi:hypothetical protein
VQGSFAFDLVQLVKNSPETFFVVSQGTLLPNQRTELVRQSIAAHASHILFIDSDMRFPADGLDRLLANGQDIIGANCKHRQADKWTAGVATLKDSKGIEQVEQIGFGFTLIRVEVFIKMPQPWFATPYDGQKFVGEDIFFCAKAEDAGHEIYIDHDLSKEIQHTGNKDFGVDL